MDYVMLNNSIKMPLIGFGTYKMPSRITEQCVSEALTVGYRHIDTAQCYGNECEVGLAVKKSGLRRKEVFVTTKLWGGHGYRDTIESIEESLKRLDLGYIDLLLIHEPTGDYREIYRAMETVYREGKIKAIGVANFLEANFRRLMETAKIVPAVNQIETHVFRQQELMGKLLKEYGTVHESWSPLAAGKNGIFQNALLQKIATAHGRTIPQVALRFLLQQGIPVIPKTTHVERMRENLSLTDFFLTNEEMWEIRTLEQGKSLFAWW